MKKNEWLITKTNEYIQSRLFLKYKFNHAFYTRLNKSSKPNKLIKKISNCCSIHQLNQVHSKKVIKTTELNEFNLTQADGIISSNIKDQSLWIYTADCIPILIADTKTGDVAASHAGWKGVCNKIIKQTIEELELSGSERKNLIVALGPSISLSKYTVKDDVLHLLLRSINEKNINLSIKSDLFKLKEGDILVDLKKFAYKQLIKEGITGENITVSNYCTFLDEELFYSWRRDKMKLFQWSCIISGNLNK
ncbi:peptidoglycan editing factor PgeF [Prochlorococcus sp. MIT 1223]|uniref:peptidoglycan editing factor PgeF n=1 Tax=Prochlorococcus sp. MIT 1223 TaxID=3096217 RepID=UPI002A761D77|nr:peptidoglycan editing factor PgeF [Prochlorococcus sp. MIT 1223]